MDFSTVLLAAVMMVLPLIGAGLLAAMVLLERPERLSTVPAADAPTPRRPRARRSDARRRR